MIPSNNRPAIEPDTCVHYIVLAEGVYYRCENMPKHEGDHSATVRNVTDSDPNLQTSMGRWQQATAVIEWSVDPVQPKPPKLVGYEEHHIRKGDKQVEDIVYGDVNGNY